MAKGLTVRTIEALKAGDKAKEIPDGLCPGLYLVVHPTRKTWSVRFRIKGRSQRYTVGTHPAIDLVTARELARGVLRAVAEGRDPGQEKKAARQRERDGGDSVKAVAAKYIARHVVPNLRPRSAYEVQRLLNRVVIPALGDKPIGDVTRADVRDLIEGRAVETPILANRLFAAIRGFYAWGRARDLVDRSPCEGLRPPAPERRRDRVLGDAEIVALWKATEDEEYPYREIVRLLLLTGQRREEVAAMRWSELNLPQGVWRLPASRTKNKQAHEVPLSRQALAILENVPHISGDFVFTTRGDKAVTSYTRTKRRLDQSMQAPHWTLHDIRRTVVSGLARLGVGLPVIEKIVNHTSGSFAGVIGTYQRFGFEGEKRQALEKWADFVERLVSGTGIVVAMRRDV